MRQIDTTPELENSLHYYLHIKGSEDESKRPFACVAFIPHEDGTVSRGISICAHNDEWRKKKGRAKAKGRLLKALRSETDSLPIRQEEQPTSLQWWFFNMGTMATTLPSLKMCQFKSIFKDQPNDLEKRMLTKPEKTAS